MSSGPTSALTRQPVGVKRSSGGLKLGEMEKDCIISSAAMRLFKQKFYEDSDGTYIYICKNCGNRAIINQRAGIYKCKPCGDLADIVKVPSCWMTNVFLSELAAMGATPKLQVEPIGYKVEQTA